MMLGQCAEAAQDFQRVVQCVLSFSLILSHSHSISFYLILACLTLREPSSRLFPADATAAQSLEKSTLCALNIDEAGKAQSRGDFHAAHGFLSQVLDDAAVSSVPLLLERAQLRCVLVACRHPHSDANCSGWTSED